VNRTAKHNGKHEARAGTRTACAHRKAAAALGLLLRDPAQRVVTCHGLQPARKAEAEAEAAAEAEVEPEAEAAAEEDAPEADGRACILQVRRPRRHRCGRS
jgi:hypothetical protein